MRAKTSIEGFESLMADSKSLAASPGSRISAVGSDLRGVQPDARETLQLKNPGFRKPASQQLTTAELVERVTVQFRSRAPFNPQCSNRFPDVLPQSDARLGEFSTSRTSTVKERRGTNEMYNPALKIDGKTTAESARCTCKGGSTSLLLCLLFNA